ncbi:MAG: methylamine dehydrogenase accessory protein MauD [Ideonella sp.]|nr:methylamine dehydrogenase accessory protein MauD [Ideonella sp.]
MNALSISVVLLWVAVIVLALLVWALSRQVGVLFERVAPMGALVTDAGPAVGSPSPTFKLPSLTSAPVAIGGASAAPTLLFFLSPTCPVCKKLLPVLKSLRVDEGRRLEVVLASDGEPDAQRHFIQAQRLEDFPYVLSTELGMGYRVSKLPYAVLLDVRGSVVAKGLINSREQLDSLLNAHDMQVSSIQSYLGQAAVDATAKAA